MMMAGIQSDEEENRAAEMELRDGNYLLSVFVSPPGATLSIEVERKIDGARWRGDFTARYITDITQRAGSVKSFSNFVKMLRCATTTNSSSSSTKSLYVDVLTYQDLEMLKTDGRNNGPNDRKHSSHSTLSNVSLDKRYLILTYITEFDRVHYPLPLLHDERNAITTETFVTRRCNQRLQNELESKKARMKTYESPRHTNFHQRPSTNASAIGSITSQSSEDKNGSNSEIERCYSDRDNTRLSETTRMRAPQLETLESTRALQVKVRALEDKLRTDAAAHKKSITALIRKNTLLEDEARKTRVAERRMSEKLRDSEFQISLLRGRLRSLNGSSGGSGARNNNVSPFRTRPPKRTPTPPPILRRYPYQGRLRSSSTPPATTRSRYINQNQLQRPSTASPTAGRNLPPHGRQSHTSRSRTSSPLYSMHSTTPPRSTTLARRSSSCPTTSRLVVPRNGVDIDKWLQQASKPKQCTPPPSTKTTMTTTPHWDWDWKGRSHELIKHRSSNRSRVAMDEAVSEVGEIDTRLYALQDYLKRRNA